MYACAWLCIFLRFCIDGCENAGDLCVYLNLQHGWNIFLVTCLHVYICVLKRVSLYMNLRVVNTLSCVCLFVCGCICSFSCKNLNIWWKISLSLCLWLCVCVCDLDCVSRHVFEKLYGFFLYLLVYFCIWVLWISTCMGLCEFEWRWLRVCMYVCACVCVCVFSCFCVKFCVCAIVILCLWAYVCV